jgi:hypothetical protein
MNQTNTIRGIGPLQIAIILLAVATAIIHFVLAPMAGVPFILNGIGYIALVVALYLPQLRQYQSLIRWALIGYTALTIVLWAILNGDFTDPIGVIDKLIEVALIACLVLEQRQARAA